MTVAIDEDWSALRFRRAEFIKNMTRPDEYRYASHSKTTKTTKVTKTKKSKLILRALRELRGQNVTAAASASTTLR